MMTTDQNQTCDCPDYRLSRRRWLQGAAVATGSTAFFGDVFREVAYGAAKGGNVLVVLSLRGGCDGLSMVVPRGKDHNRLERLRPSIVVPEASLIGGDTRFGLHPQFAPLLPMWEAGTFGAVHAVGLPAPNRSHFDAMTIVEDADPGSSERRGWLNRLIGLDKSAKDQSAVQLGSSTLPTSMVGPAPALGLNRLSDIKMGTLGSGTSGNRVAGMRKMWKPTGGPMKKAVHQAGGISKRLGSLGTTGVNQDAYPGGPLQAVLADTAALIKADVGTEIVTLDHGGWDMHTDVGNLDYGDMRSNLGHLTASLAAFFTDLGAASSRVTVITISEFGRRVEQNGSGGLDHGYGNVMLMLGAGVRGGEVRGGWKSLSKLKEGDVRVAQDFRSVLWEVIDSRFPGSSRAKVFPGFHPEKLGTMTKA